MDVATITIALDNEVTIDRGGLDNNYLISALDATILTLCQMQTGDRRKALQMKIFLQEQFNKRFAEEPPQGNLIIPPSFNPKK